MSPKLVVAFFSPQSCSQKRKRIWISADDSSRANRINCGDELMHFFRDWIRLKIPAETYNSSVTVSEGSTVTPACQKTSKLRYRYSCNIPVHSAVSVSIAGKSRKELVSLWLTGLKAPTSVGLQVIYSGSHYTTSFFLFCFLKPQLQLLSTIWEHKTTKTITRFGAYLYSASTQHGNLHPAG